jgi:hypothetical protein
MISSLLLPNVLHEFDREQEVDNEEPINVFHVEQVEKLSVSNKAIQIETRKDKTLTLVHDFVLNGWPHAWHWYVFQFCGILSRNHIQREMLHIFEFLQMLLKKFPMQA